MRDSPMVTGLDSGKAEKHLLFLTLAYPLSLWIGWLCVVITLVLFILLRQEYLKCTIVYTIEASILSLVKRKTSRH